MTQKDYKWYKKAVIDEAVDHKAIKKATISENNKKGLNAISKKIPIICRSVLPILTKMLSSGFQVVWSLKD